MGKNSDEIGQGPEAILLTDIVTDDEAEPDEIIVLTDAVEEPADLDEVIPLTEMVEEPADLDEVIPLTEMAEEPADLDEVIPLTEMAATIQEPSILPLSGDRTPDISGEAAPEMEETDHAVVEDINALIENVDAIEESSAFLDLAELSAGDRREKQVVIEDIDDIDEKEGFLDLSDVAGGQAPEASGDEIDDMRSDFIALDDVNKGQPEIVAGLNLEDEIDEEDEGGKLDPEFTDSLESDLDKALEIIEGSEAIPPGERETIKIPGMLSVRSYDSPERHAPDDFVEEKIQKVITHEDPEIRRQEIEAAVERVVKRLFADKIDRILIDVIEKTVSREIRRIKTLLVDDDGGDMK